MALIVQTQLRCSGNHMGIGYVSVVKDAAKLGGLLMPLLVISGLLLIWVLIVVICLYLGHGYEAPLGGNILLR